MLEKIKGFFSGKKTYAVVAAGVIYNLLAKKGWLPEGMTESGFTEFVNNVLLFAGIGFARAGITKSGPETPVVPPVAK